MCSSDLITVDTTYQTVADAEIAESEDFHLSPMFGFKGSVHLAASKEHLVFGGYAKPKFNCDSIASSWIRFTAEVDPLNVMIPIDNAVTDNGDHLRAGVFQSYDNKTVYGAFLAPKNNVRDSAMIDARGYLTYYQPANEYRITTKEKMDKPNIPGEYTKIGRAHV